MGGNTVLPWERTVVPARPRRWYWWVGVNAMLYARWPFSSPPLTLKATGVMELTRLMTAEEARWKRAA